MNKKAEQKLYNLIELSNEKNAGRDTNTIPYGRISSLLRECNLEITEYPNGNTIGRNNILIGYSFQLNDRDFFNELNNYSSELGELCEELLENGYEFEHDGDEISSIEIKYVRTPITKLPAPPKITFDDCVSVVLKNINDANHSIFGAIAWISNKKIVNALINKANEGVIIELISDNNDPNLSFRNKDEYKKLPFPIYYVNNLNKDYWGNKALMHEKFCVIDNKIAIYGTFNWSEHAILDDNDIHEDDNLSSVDAYNSEFKKLIQKYNCHYSYEYNQW